MNFKRDISEILVVAFICATYFAQATVSLNENYGPQQLADDKLRNRLTPAVGAQVIANQVSVNDLQEEKRSPSRVTISRTLINGNHATYIEPPANFKPIIYDVDSRLSANSISEVTEKQPESDEKQILSFVQGTGAADGGSSILSASSDNTYRWIWSPLLSNSLQLKPSIERWSDWHDMSIEPDLTPSDSSASSPVLPLNVSIAGKLGEKASAIGSNAFKSDKAHKISTSASNWSTGNPLDTSKDSSSFSTATTDPAKVSSLTKSSTYTRAANMKNITRVDRVPGWHSNSSSLLADNSRQVVGAIKSVSNKQQAGGLDIKLLHSKVGNSLSRKDELQIKGGQQKAVTILSSPSSLQAADLSARKTGQPSSSDTNAHVRDVTLNRSPLLSPVQKLAAAMVAQQVASEFSNYQPRAAHPQWKIILHDSSRSLSGKSNSSSSSPHQAKDQLKKPYTRRMKRRRKSKSNAEVRIQQLVAASQQQQQLMLSNGNQVNDFAVIHHHQHQQQQQQLPQEQHDRGQLLATTGERVLKALMSHQRIPGMQVKRFHAPITTNSSSTARRTIRRKKLKTLLPVGLSSWFLGGIRDLDGRHWQMPIELLNRLAVNDVDFHPPSSTANKSEVKQIAENAADIFLFSLDSAKEFEGPPSKEGSGEQKQLQQALGSQVKSTVTNSAPR